MNYYAPLFNFWSKEETFVLTKYLSVKKNAYEISKIDKDHYLALYEITDINTCNFWAVINHKKPKYLSLSVILNTLLISIWIFAPNKVTLKFKFGDDDYFRKMLDRFQFNGVEKSKLKYDLDDLINIRVYYNSLIKITRINKRLQTALFNTFRGCVSYDWRTTFILYTAALEALLTYSSGWGITKRLAKSYACLVEDKVKKRDSLYARFIKLYSIRSDLMHGRLRRYAKPSGNLKRLSELSDLLRNLWKTILEKPVLIKELEKDDVGRKNFFAKIHNGYTPPSI